MKYPYFLLALTLVFLGGATNANAQSMFTKRTAELRDSPGNNATVVETLPANTQLKRTSERNGPWVKVQTPEGNSGWLHNFDISSSGSAEPATNGNSSTGGMRTLGGLAGRGGSSSTTPTTTAGVRGWGNGKTAQAPAGAEQESQDADNEADQVQTNASKNKQSARPGYSASTGGQASPYQRMPTTTPQQAMPPGMSTYSSGNQNWGNGGSANGWGAPNK